MSRPVLVFGNGASGRAAAELVRSQGLAVEVLDDGGNPAAAGAALSDCEFAIVSPGVSLAHPWVVGSKRRGIRLVSEMQYGAEELKRRGWRLFAVTGSKGKSSVVKLLAEAFGGVACGNYGLPVCEVANRDGRGEAQSARRIAVVEVSSFMMETTDLARDAFECAAVLNLQEDHLDRHGSVEVYHALKRRLLDCTRNPVLGGGPVADGDAALWRGSYFDNPVLAGNAAAAVRMMRAGGLGDERIRASFLAFRPLPHRFELVAELGGVSYIDDSKATSIAALRAGVRMCAPRKVRLIAGGLAKGDDPRDAISDLTFGVQKVYTIGNCAGSFLAAWSGTVECELCGTLEKAVESARRDAASGEIVLLSPGTASFDQFKSFEERGEVFARLVKKEKE